MEFIFMLSWTMNLILIVFWPVSGLIALWHQCGFEREEWSMNVFEEDRKVFEKYKISDYIPGISIYEWKRDRLLISIFIWNYRDLSVEAYMKKAKRCTMSWHDYVASLPEKFVKELRHYNCLESPSYPGEPLGYNERDVFKNHVKIIMKKYGVKQKTWF